MFEMAFGGSGCFFSFPPKNSHSGKQGSKGVVVVVVACGYL
jgi:hypothetical protein